MTLTERARSGLREMPSNAAWLLSKALKPAEAVGDAAESATAGARDRGRKLTATMLDVAPSAGIPSSCGCAARVTPPSVPRRPRKAPSRLRRSPGSGPTTLARWPSAGVHDRRGRARGRPPRQAAHRRRAACRGRGRPPRAPGGAGGRRGAPAGRPVRGRPTSSSRPSARPRSRRRARRSSSPRRRSSSPRRGGSPRRPRPPRAPPRRRHTDRLRRSPRRPSSRPATPTPGSRLAERLREKAESTAKESSVTEVTTDEPQQDAPAAEEPVQPSPVVKPSTAKPSTARPSTAKSSTAEEPTTVTGLAERAGAGARRVTGERIEGEGFGEMNMRIGRKSTTERLLDTSTIRCRSPTTSGRP